MTNVSMFLFTASGPFKRQRIENNGEASSSRSGLRFLQPLSAPRVSLDDREVLRSHPLPTTPVAKAVNRKPRMFLDMIEVEPIRSSLKRKYKDLKADEYSGKFVLHHVAKVTKQYIFLVIGRHIHIPSNQVRRLFHLRRVLQVGNWPFVARRDGHVGYVFRR